MSLGHAQFRESDKNSNLNFELVDYAYEAVLIIELEQISWEILGDFNCVK